MIDLAAPTQGPQQSEVIQLAATTSLNVAAVATFVPCFFLLWLGREVRGWQDWAVYALALTVWFIGLLPALHRVRPAISTLATAFILAAPLIISPLGGPGWVMVTITAFAIIVGAAFSFPTAPALVATVTIAGLDGYVRYAQPAAAAFVDSDLMHGMIGPLLDIVCGAGLISARRAWVQLIHQGDRLTTELRADEAVKQHELSTFAARTAVERRIHETILNTLSAISMGMQATNASAAQQICRRDLEQIGSGATISEETHASVVIRLALDALDGSPLLCSVRIDDDPLLLPSIANAIRDAVVEALRNVERHSGQHQASINVRVTDYLSVRIHDDGVGFSQIATEKFGTRDTIKLGMAAIGGSSVVESHVGGGTTVTLTLPTSSLMSLTNSAPEPPIRGGLIGGSLASRIGMLGTNLFLVIAGWAIASPLPSGTFVFLGIMTYALINTALCLAWNTPTRLPLTITAIVLGICIFVYVTASSPGCGDISSVTWLISSVSGGGTMLILNASRQLIVQLGSILAFTLVTLGLTLVMPPACQVQPLAAIFINLSYMVSIVYVIIWVDRNFEAQRQQAARIWKRILRERSELDRLVSTRESWDLLGPSTRTLLQGVADGRLAIDDPLVRATAAIEATAIRGRLGLGPTPALGLDPPFTILLSQLGAIAAGLGATIDGDEIARHERMDAYPDELTEFLADLIRQCAQSGELLTDGVSIRALTDGSVDELIVTLPAGNLRVRATSIGDCEIEVLGNGSSDGYMRLSIRRSFI